MAKESKTLEALRKELEYVPIFVTHNGQFVRLTIENYEEVTGKKLPKESE